MSSKRKELWVINDGSDFFRVASKEKSTYISKLYGRHPLHFRQVLPTDSDLDVVQKLANKIASLKWDDVNDYHIHVNDRVTVNLSLTCYELHAIRDLLRRL